MRGNKAPRARGAQNDDWKVIDFAVAFTSLTKGLEALRAIQDIDKNLDAATYKAKIADLMSAVADAKLALIEAREEAASKDKEIDQLK